MNILLINHYAGSPELGMEFRPYYMAKEWVKAGHQVLIIGGSFSHLRKKQPEGREALLDGICYRWVKLNAYKGNGVGRIRSMFSFVSKLWWGYKKYVGNFKPDVVIASSTYPLDIYPARRIAKHYGAKLVYEVHDLWPLSPMELGGYSKYHPFIQVMQMAEDYCYRHADKVVSLLPAALPHMVERGMNPKKFAYVPNGFDPDDWNDIVEPSTVAGNVIRELKNGDKFVVCYAGGHALSNALDSLIDAMKLLRGGKVVVVMIGDGQEKARLKHRVENENIDNVIMLDAVPKKEIFEILSMADALYIGWSKNPLYRFGISPNKLIDYMMAGRPIVHSVEAANDWVKDADCGISVDAEDAAAIARAFLAMSTWEQAQLEEVGLRGRKYCQDNFDYTKLAKEFINTPPPSCNKLIYSNIHYHLGVLNSLHKEGQFVVGFAGAHGIANSLYTVIDAIASLSQKNVSLVLIGDGQEKENLIHYSEMKNYQNIYFLDPVSKKQIPELLTRMDCLYIGLQKQSLFRFGISPNKMFDYMMAAKPIVQAIEAGNNMVKEANCGLAVEPECPVAIANAIMSIKAMTLIDRIEMGMNGRRFALTSHSYPVLAQNFIHVLAE